MLTHQGGNYLSCSRVMGGLWFRYSPSNVSGDLFNDAYDLIGAFHLGLLIDGPASIFEVHVPYIIHPVLPPKDSISARVD